MLGTIHLSTAKDCGGITWLRKRALSSRFVGLSAGHRPRCPPASVFSAQGLAFCSISEAWSLVSVFRAHQVFPSKAEVFLRVLSRHSEAVLPNLIP